MKRGDIIDSLVAELAPVRRLRGADVRATLWISFACVCVGLVCCGVGARPDLSDKLRDAEYLAQAAALLAMLGFAARQAFRSSIPGIAVSLVQQTAPAIASAAWVAFVLRGSPSASELSSSWAAGLPCVVRIVGLALVPAITIFAMLRRAAPISCRRTGLLAATSAAALGAVGTQLICAKDGSLHVLLWHAGPIGLAAGLGLAAGRLLLMPARQRGRTPRVVDRRIGKNC